MFRSNLHRGMMAVVFAAALALAGARPAAAAPVWSDAWDWLGRLWSGVTLLQPSQEAIGFEIDPNGDPVPTGDCGPEIDPDGRPRCAPLPSTCSGPDCGPEIDPNG
ncbi:MAG: hypothetical protein ACJ76J_27540 [Thermoanaerobaculia bacterium]